MLKQKKGMVMILISNELSNTYYVPKHIIKGLKFDKVLKRYYVESYIYDENVCVRKSVTYFDKHDIFYIQRILCMIIALLSYRK